MKVGIHLVFLCCIFIFASCNKSENRACFKSLGKVKKETRPVQDFNSISLSDQVNLILTQDTFNYIEVEAPGNLVKFVKTGFDGSTLEISNTNKCDFLRSYKYEINVYVKVKQLDNFLFSGTGEVSSTNTLITPKLTMNFWSASGSVDISLETGTSECNLHTGPGDLTIKGSAGVSSVYSMGNGFVHLENYKSGYSFIDNSGTGDFYINVEKELGVKINSLGSVFYTGDPLKVTLEGTGEGKLIKL